MTATGVAQFLIRPWFESGYSCEVQALVTFAISSYVPPRVGSLPGLDHINGLQLADPHFMDDSHIDVLLGSSIYSHIMLGQVMKGEPNMPIATQAHLGWLLTGEVSGDHDSSRIFTASLHCATETLQNFWRREEVPKVSALTENEHLCQHHFQSTHRRDDSGRYVVKLPFKNSVYPKAMNLGDSYATALKMLHRMENKFDADQELKLAYSSLMDEYERLGHMVPVHSVVQDQDIKDCFFLPHHGVWKKSSSTTKLRTVLNGSIRTRSGNSLNDLLYPGQNLLPNLLDLVCKWRYYEFIFTADIEKMFRQILIDPSDQPFQSILWRYNRHKPVQIYRWSRTDLPLRPSSRREISSKMPQIIATLTSWDHKSSTPRYTWTTCCLEHTLSQKRSRNSRRRSTSSGLEVSLCTSGKQTMLDWLPTELLASGDKTLSDPESVTSILGLCWKPREDVYMVQVDCAPINGPVTKRTVLSKIARIFDPMEWLTPVVITA